MTDYTAPLATLHAALTQLQAGQLSTSDFIRQWQTQAASLPLPANYTQVLNNLFMRLESGMAFAQESCSFSVEAVHGQLAQWLAKATEKLSA